MKFLKALRRMRTIFVSKIPHSSSSFVFYSRQTITFVLDQRKNFIYLASSIILFLPRTRFYKNQFEKISRCIVNNNLFLFLKSKTLENAYILRKVNFTFWVCVRVVITHTSYRRIIGKYNIPIKFVAQINREHNVFSISNISLIVNIYENKYVNSITYV